MRNISYKLIGTAGKAIALCLCAGLSATFAEECNEQTMDAFAYEDCLAEHNLPIPGAKPKASNDGVPRLQVINPNEVYNPFGRDAYLTSSFGENRGTRYHMGVDYSTDMTEGWVVYAPEDGVVSEIKTSPYGYGKVLFFKGNSGKTWVFAHQSSFSAQLDDIVYKKMYDTKKNDIAISPKVSFKKGDTLTFAGSSGIGNPHLHLEVRTADNKGLSPCGQGALCLDTIAPQIFAAAVTYKDEVSFTSAEALDKGCIETPIKNTFENDAPVHISFKIADYSREPKENPMSVRRLEVFRYDEKMFSKIQDTIPFSKQLRIRDELLWAEEADTAGDWHYITAPFPPQSEYRLEVEDYAGNVTTKKFSIRSHCKNNGDFPKQNFQKTPLITYLSRPALDLGRCDSSYAFSVRDKDGKTLSTDLCKAFPHKLTFLGKVAETFPAATKIIYSKGDFENTIYMTELRKGAASATWTVKDEDFEISQKVTGLSVKTNEGTGVLAFTRNVTDSLNFYEFHPKGLQFTGNWEVCIDAHTAPAPLYWLGETSRNWFIFSKQTSGKKRCASTNELRDIASIDNQAPPTLGFPYWDNTIIGGLHQPALKIPLNYKYDGIPNGNSITVKSGKNWIAAEYDSEPREIILEGAKLPEEGEKITIQIVDEGKHKATYTVTIPGM